MGPKKRQEAAEPTEDDGSMQTTMETSLLELQKMFHTLLSTQKKQEEQAKQEQDRQEQRWRGMVHQFNLLQGEVRQERWEMRRSRGPTNLLEGSQGLLFSAPVSTATSPARALTHEAVAGAAATVPGPAAAVQAAAAAFPGPAASPQAAAATFPGPAAAHHAAAAAFPAAAFPAAALPAAGPAAATVLGLAAGPASAAVAGRATAAATAQAGGIPGSAVVPGPAGEAAAPGPVAAATSSPAAAVVVPGTGEGPSVLLTSEPEERNPVQFSGWKGPKMQKYTEDEDVEHFLMTYERVATASRCPKTEWALNLVPLLTGKARAAYVAMDFKDAMDYDKIKEAILEKFEIHPETYRQRFRSTQVLQGESPKELFTRLRELYEKWVCPQAHTKEEIGDMLILEQFLRMVNSDVRLCIKEHNPKCAKEAVVLAESFIAARRGSRPYQMSGVKDINAARPSKSEGGRDGGPSGKSLNTVKASQDEIVCYYCGEAGHIKIKCPKRKAKPSIVAYIPKYKEGEDIQEQWESLIMVRVNGKQVQALVDTGSSQTIKRAVGG